MGITTETTRYRYTVDVKLVFPKEGDGFDINNSLIKSLIISKNYNGDFAPVIQLSLSLPTNIYYRLIAEKLTANIQLHIQKYVYDETQAPDARVLPFKTDIVNDQFILIINDNMPFLDKDEYKQAAEINSVSSSGGMTPLTTGGNEIKLYLYKKQDIINTKKIINTVIEKANMTDIITYLLSKSGIRHVLMAPLDNDKEYDEILLPPLTVIGNLKYLESQYGFYKKGAVVFFDVRRAYIVDRSHSCKAFATGEIQKTIFSIKNGSNADRFNTGSYFDKNDGTTYINVLFNNMQITTDSVINDQIEGNKRISIDDANGLVNTIEPDITTRGEGTYKVIHNKYSNPYAITSEETTLKSKEKTIAVSVPDIDIDAVTPNKEFRFKFEDNDIDKENGGEYQIVSSTFVFNSKGESYELASTHVFTK